MRAQEVSGRRLTIVADPEPEVGVRLERRFVTREASVAVDPEDGAVDSGHCLHALIDRRERRAHRIDEVALPIQQLAVVPLAVLGEPCAVVVLSEIGKEAERVWSESRERHSPSCQSRVRLWVPSRILPARFAKRFSDAQLIVAGAALAAVSLAAWDFSPNVWVLLAILPPLSLG